MASQPRPKPRVFSVCWRHRHTCSIFIVGCRSSDETLAEQGEDGGHPPKGSRRAAAASARSAATLAMGGKSGRAGTHGGAWCQRAKKDTPAAAFGEEGIRQRAYRLSCPPAPALLPPHAVSMPPRRRHAVPRGARVVPPPPHPCSIAPRHCSLRAPCAAGRDASAGVSDVGRGGGGGRRGTHAEGAGALDAAYVLYNPKNSAARHVM